MIYTSYWGKLKQLVKQFGKDNIICVSRYQRYWNGKRCSLLYPSKELLDGYKKGLVSEEEYTKIFRKYLDTLDVDNCYKIFDGCIFVCYEKSGFCHRHIISQWLRENGYQCWEYE